MKCILKKVIYFSLKSSSFSEYFLYYLYLLDPSVTNKMWQKISFTRNKAGLNSEFSFFLTGCLNKVKEPSLFNFLPIAGWRTDWFNASNDIRLKWNVYTLVRDLNSVSNAISYSYVYRCSLLTINLLIQTL